MQKIIINGRFLLHKVTGVERFAREMLLELDNIIIPGEIEIAIPPETVSVPDYKNISIVRVGKLHNRAWEHLSFPRYVKRENGISLNLCNVAPLLDPGIVCIHDVKIKARPKDFRISFRIWYNILFLNTCKRAKKIITVSNFSKREIEKYYNVNPKRIVVIPNAWQHYERTGYDDNALEKYGLEKKQYYFSMCSLEPNKNFSWIAKAAKNNSESIFATAGSINSTVFSEGFGFERPDNMKLLGYVSDEEAKSLMRDCKAFLFLAFYEGFGIPPLEAISAGCKNVLVSDIEVMHEVYGDAVNYVDPNDSTIDILGFPQHDTSELLERYSWEKSAKILLGIIRGL